MSLGAILLIIVILLLIGALPTWPYSGNWGYFPAGGLGLVVIIILILVLMGKFPRVFLASHAIKSDKPIHQEDASGDLTAG